MSLGPLIRKTDVEDAVEQTLRDWLPTYLGQAERDTDRDQDTLPNPRSYSRYGEFTKWPEDQLPAVVIVCPGTIGDPQLDGEGYYRVQWAVAVGVVVSSKDKPSTDALASIYSGEVRRLLVQRPSLGGFAENVRWEAERMADMDPDRTRTLAAGVVEVTVETRDAVQRRPAGLPTEVPAPPRDPIPPVAEVDTVDITFEQQ